MTLRSSAFVFLPLCLLTAAAWGQVPSGNGDWPQWRGPNRDGISTDKGLLKEWPKEGPRVLWQVDSVGVGYSSLAVKDGRIFTQGDLNGVEHIIALDAKDGHTLWAVQPGPLAQLLETTTATQFKQADRNGDGKISEAEALARFGWEWNKFDEAASEPLEVVAKKRAEAWMKELDKNGDGKIGYDECGNQFRDVFERMDSTDPKADAAALAAQRTTDYLKLLDKDSDGRISREECKGTALERHFGRIDSKEPGTDKGDELLSAEEIETSLKKFEAGKDGFISPAELSSFYVASRYKGDGVLTAKELRSTVGGYRNGMGDGPRGTPTVDGNRVYVEGANGDVDCLEAATGKTIWHVNLRSDFGGSTPGWGYSESPLITGDLVIVTPGGNAGTLVALNKLTGKPVWQSKEVKEGAHYSSPVVAEIGGIKQIVQFARESVFGVSLTDGKPLWRYAAPANGTANCCSPIIEGDFVFASSSYGVGGGLAKINSAGSTQQAEEVYFDKKIACHHGGMVKVGDYMYSSAGGTLMCVEFKTGKIMWQARGAGKGALCVADGMLYILGEGFEVALAEVNPEAYVEHGKFKLQPRGRWAWAYPIVTGGRLYIRDQESLTAYDVRAKSND
ncbi:MAG: PQQ-binding-like beta-propeller repeat protein [Planctomycetales bacterium]|nr:PQQ-binding-like beta-propeller repeat protein [Planctomycetales bacterium]